MAIVSRAGEQGRGFAVVSGEVRTLAQRSATAAREIKSLIAASLQTVETGARQAGEAGRTMDDIVGRAQGVTQLIRDISSATVEQTAGIEQVTLAVGQLDGHAAECGAGGRVRDRRRRLPEGAGRGMPVDAFVFPAGE